MNAWRQPRRLVIWSLAVVAFTLLMPLATTQAQASDYYLINVDAVQDNNSAGGCTLRDALTVVNSNATGSVGDCTVTTVGSPAGLVYELRLPAYTYTLAGTQLDITTSGQDLTVRLVGQGSGTTIIQAAETAGSATHRVLFLFEVDSDTLRVSLDGVQVRHGSPTAATSYGAGIYVKRAKLTVRNSLITDNSNTSSSGAGGGIYYENTGDNTIENSTISNNHTDYWGGGIATLSSLVNITNSVLEENSADLDGGGIYASFGSTITLTNGTSVQANTSLAAGGGVSMNSGSNFSMDDASISDNQAQGDGGGAAFASANPVDIVSATISGNRSTAGNGGGLWMASTGGGTISSTIITDNRALDGGGVFLDAVPGLVTLVDSCLVNNGDGVSSSGGITHSASDNWWGAANGPGGVGVGFGDSVSAGVDVNSFETAPILGCPTLPAYPIDDTYTVDNPTDTVSVAAPGVLENDVRMATAALYTQAERGTAAINSDGSFTYTPGGTFEGLDGFEYLATTGETIGVGLVCMTQSGLALAVPPDQQTPVDTPLPLPGVTVSTTGDPGTTLVTVELTVSNGTLAVAGGNSGILSPYERCRERLLGSMVAAPALNDKRLLKPAPRSLAAQGTGVTVTGSGTGTLTLQGTVTNVNALLTTLVYTPNAGFQGIDQLYVVANTADAFASSVVLIQVGSGGTVVPVGSTTTVGAAGGGAVGGFALLSVLSSGADSIIRGDVPPNTVPNGDVFVTLFAVNGTFVVDPAQLGDADLLALDVEHAAEVFGLTFGGAGVPAYNNRIKVCLRGIGRIYYRDATGMPRITVQLPTFLEGVFTCAWVPNSGTLILVLDVAAVQTDTVAPASVTDCMARIDSRVNLRTGADESSGVITVMPPDITLTVRAVQGDWVQVDYLGTTGWANRRFVTLDGAGCPR